MVFSSIPWQTNVNHVNIYRNIFMQCQKTQWLVYLYKITLKNTSLQIMMILHLLIAVLPQAPQSGKQNSFLIYHFYYFYFNIQVLYPCSETHNSSSNWHLKEHYFSSHAIHLSGCSCYSDHRIHRKKGLAASYHFNLTCSSAMSWPHITFLKKQGWRSLFCDDPKTLTSQRY